MKKNKKQSSTYKLTPEEIKKLYTIANKLARKFTFGYFSREDIVQECMFLALEALPDYDGERNIFNFLYTHMWNRLVNLIRDKKERIVPPCQDCAEGRYCNIDSPCKDYQNWLTRNKSKKNLVSPKSIEYHDSESYIYETDLAEKSDLNTKKDTVESKLKPKERELWLMYMDGVKLKKTDLVFLKKVVAQILEGENA